MSMYTRKTFDERFGQQGPEFGPSGGLQFMRGMANPWGNWFSKMTTVGTIGAMAVAPMAVPGMIATKVAWHGAWGAMMAPMEIGYQTVRTLRFLEGLGNIESDYATQFVDTRMAYTMRQAALNAMHNSAYSLRGALGNEARMLHS